jgi:hypothetical protein
MDKLDKLPPKDIKLKDSPIAQGIISNTIFQVLWNGLYFIILLLIRHYAVIYGIPPFLAILLGVVGFFLMALSVNLLRRRNDARSLNATGATLESVSPEQLRTDPDKPTIEILSPFDHDEVGLYETVRGRVFPPDQKLQAAVFAGDKQWYPQSSPVIVTGLTWSVKCQFGSLEKPRKGTYRVVVLSGAELKKGPYSELPANIPRSNIITVHKSEITIEHKLASALSERDEYKNQLLKVKADGETQHENYKLERDGLLNERKVLNEKLLEAQRVADETKKRLNEEVNQRNNWMNSYYEASRKLAELQYVVKILEDQAKALQEHVIILRDFKVRVDLIDTSLGPPRIRFGFKIRNEALPNIMIHEKGVGGKVYFRDHPLTETCRFDPNMTSKVENIEHKEEGSLYLDQKLTAAEIDRISKALESNPNAEFSFEHIIIKVSGGDNFSYEATEPLHIPGDYQRVKLSDCQINSNTENP